MSLLCHFSETEVKRLRQRTGSKQTVYKNPSFKGLELVVGKKSKTWYFRTSTIRKKLGHWPDLSVDAAISNWGRIKADRFKGISEFSNAETISLNNYLGLWLKKTHQKLAKERVRDLRAALGELANESLNRFTKDMITQWRQDFVINRERPNRPRSAATANRHISFLKGRLSDAVDDQFINANPLYRMSKLPENDERVRFLNHDEEERLMSAISLRTDFLKPMCILALNTGMRRGELYSLKWSEVYWETRNIRILGSTSKSGKTKFVPMNDQCYKALTDWKYLSTKSDLVFPRSNGQIRRGVCREFLTLMGEAGINDFRFHDMRHDFASKLVQKGVDIYQVKELLRHDDIRMTQRYSHLAPSQLLQVVQTLRRENA